MKENYDRISAERFFENNPKWFEYISESEDEFRVKLKSLLLL